MVTSIRHFILTATILLPFLILCSCWSQEQTQPQSNTVGQTQPDVTYQGVAGLTLTGTLVIPDHKQETRVPGAVIVAGSGPTDRNGNQPVGFTTNLYIQIVPEFAQALRICSCVKWL